VNLCDLYAFPGRPGSTVLVMTVNPDAGRSSPVTFRPDAVYQFAVDANGGVEQILGLRIRFAEPDGDGCQPLNVLYAGARDLPDAGAGAGAGAQVGSGITGSAFSVDLPGLPAGRGWAGLAADPFWADGAALFAFLQAAHEGRFTPDAFAEPDNIFQGRNVTAIVLEIPDALLGTARSSVWATVSLYGHAPARQVSGMGQPMLRPLFFNVPGPDTEELNAGAPAEDRQRYADRIIAVATRLASIAGHQAPEVHARHVARAFLPDVLGYTPGEPARFWPGGGTGRSLTDDASVPPSRSPPVTPSPSRCRLPSRYRPSRMWDHRTPGSCLRWLNSSASGPPAPTPAGRRGPPLPPAPRCCRAASPESAAGRRRCSRLMPGHEPGHVANPAHAAVARSRRRPG
jgi:hypothetical protein